MASTNLRMALPLWGRVMGISLLVEKLLLLLTAVRRQKFLKNQKTISAQDPKIGKTILLAFVRK
jgi:hypothetical protein